MYARRNCIVALIDFGRQKQIKIILINRKNEYVGQSIVKMECKDARWKVYGALLFNGFNESEVLARRNLTICDIVC